MSLTDELETDLWNLRKGNRELESRIYAMVYVEESHEETIEKLKTLFDRYHQIERHITRLIKSEEVPEYPNWRRDNE